MFRVLLPVDADEDHTLAAAEAATSLPDAAEAVHVTVLNVQPEVDVADESEHVNSESWYNATDFPQSAVQTKEYLEDAGIDVEMRREHADPAEAIIKIADEIDADRIIMSGRKRTPVGKVLFGSVTQSVLLNSAVPVTVAIQ